MKPLSLLLLSIILFGAGCASVPITPAAITKSHGREEERVDALKRWQDAVSLCNAFLESPERKTLPAGNITIGEQGMEFVTGGVSHPINIRCTSWGYWLNRFNMAAQERSDGYVVGYVSPRKDRVLDNSFFKQTSGRPFNSASMALLILHELTHSYYHLGAVSFSKGVAYYAESIFLLRYKKHSQERLPFQTSAEIKAFFARIRKEHESLVSSSAQEPNQQPEPMRMVTYSPISACLLCMVHL